MPHSAVWRIDDLTPPQDIKLAVRRPLNLIRRVLDPVAHGTLPTVPPYLVCRGTSVAINGVSSQRRANMVEIQCGGCGLPVDATVLRPSSGLPPQINLDNVDINLYATTCRVARERGRAPAAVLDCPYMRQTIDVAIAAGQV